MAAKQYDIRHGKTHYEIIRFNAPYPTEYRYLVKRTPGTRDRPLAGRFYRSREELIEHYPSIRTQIRDRIPDDRRRR